MEGAIGKLEHVVERRRHTIELECIDEQGAAAHLAPGARAEKAAQLRRCAGCSWRRRNDASLAVAKSFERGKVVDCSLTQRKQRK